MKRLFFGLLFGLLSTFSFAQTLPDFDAIKLETKEDFNTTADDAALQASNFLFSTPLEKNNIDRLKSLQYIIKWMSGTPDYSFTLDEQATKFAKKNDDLLGLYMAAMTKYVLENKEDAKDQNKIKLNAVKMIIAYAKDEKNRVKPNSELKKAIEADEKGQLSEYLKIQ
ncbi:hypothetical protein [Foetidibacter luteolus]|uniref:hypothetical protein n=1 Tax=Foetidibacter luteolus TaxID=2608880 RepID=UPI00129B19DA|nr:hypothetical protein [Foetidibacter luteolus]